MIATTRGLAILAGIAAALLVLLLVTGPRGTAPVERSLLPGFDPDRVHRITLAQGQAVTYIDRVGTEWRIVSPPGLADPAAVDAIFTALRGGRWHRRAAKSVAGVPAEPQSIRSIAVDKTTLTLGSELPGAGQTWIVRGDEALLVDNWVAAALSPKPLDLRVRHPLDCASAKSIVAMVPPADASKRVGSIRIEGRRLVEPQPLWLDDRWLASLADACARVEIVSLDGHRDYDLGFRITADKNELRQSGSCIDKRYVYVDTSSGAGCVDAAALRALQDAIQKLIQAPQDAIDLSPLPIDPVKLTLPDGSVLDLSSRPRIGDADADPERARELVDALRKHGDAAAPRPATKPSGTIRATARDGTEVTLELFDKAIGRAGEPAVIRIRDAEWSTITRPSSALRDATRWREDATTITSLTLDKVTYKRGAALGEWTREPAGTVDATLVDALAETLATVRAPAGPPPRAIAHRLSVTFTPPAGTPTTHTIEFGAPSHDGCAGRLDGAPVVLPLPLCTAALALASKH